jgi:hypothetical protein
MSCMTSGTGVNPSGRLIWAPAAVATAMRNTAATRIAVDVSAPAVQAFNNVPLGPVRPAANRIGEGF